MKYIYVAEGKTRIHFHLLINRVIDLYTEDIDELWKHGMHKLVFYQGGYDDAVRMASYFLKEKRAAFYESDKKVFRRRWSASKNLVKPEEKVETLGSNNWSPYIQPPKGYYVETDSVVESVSLEGYPYRFYRLIKIGGAYDDNRNIVVNRRGNRLTDDLFTLRD